MHLHHPDSMAGAEEQKPSMTTGELVTLIRQVKRKPIERDTLYNEIKDYSDVAVSELQSDPQMN